MSTPLSKAANQFAIDLFQCYLRRHGDKYRNLLLCPYLVYHSLAMMLVGARGATEEQLMKVLRIPKLDGSGSLSNSNTQSSSSSSSPSTSPGKANTKSSTSLTDLTSAARARQANRSPSPASSSGSSLGSPYSRKTSPSRRRVATTDSAAPKVTEGAVKSGSRKSRQSERSRLQQKVIQKPSLVEKSLGSRTLTPDGPNEARHREFLLLSEQLLHGNHEFVHLASFIYLDKSAKRTERYKALLRDYYETKPKKIDYDNVELLLKTVNEDVARSTENIYNDILSRQEAQKLEKAYMLLVNAVFFRGFWLSNFTDVKKAPFIKCPQRDDTAKQASDAFGQQSAATGGGGAYQEQAAGQSHQPTQQAAASTTQVQVAGVQASQTPPQPQSQSQAQQQLQPPPQQPVQYTVNMMSKLDYLPVVSDEQLDARIIKMPFEASDLQMLLILPRNRQSDSTYLCEKISAAKINHIVEQFAKSKCKTVRVSMPIFCIDSGKISIQSTLVTMGASDLFDKLKANMNGVCENKHILLHKILHRCFIICDNRGSITSSSFEKAKRRQARLESGISSGRSGVEEFVADHPFMYIIIDSLTKTILMVGLYTDPSETLEVINENQLSPEEAHQIYTEGVYRT